VASLNNAELTTALLSCNRQLASIGLQLRIVNGVVSLLTTGVENKALTGHLKKRKALIKGGRHSMKVGALPCRLGS